MRSRARACGPCCAIVSSRRATVSTVSAGATKPIGVALANYLVGSALDGASEGVAARSAAVSHALNSRAIAGPLHNRAALLNPNTRARIAATAATAGWHDGRGRDGWWRHRNGGGRDGWAEQ